MCVCTPFTSCVGPCKSVHVFELYVMYKSWLRGVFRVYTTQIGPLGLRLGAYALQTSSGLGSGRNTQNTPHNHDLYITYRSNTCTDLHGPTHEVKGVHMTMIHVIYTVIAWYKEAILRIPVYAIYTTCASIG